MIDSQLLFSDAQNVTAAAASTNIIDTGAAQDWGPGKQLYVVVQVTTAMVDASSNSTLAVTLESDTAAAFSSATTIQTIGTLAAVSAAGTMLVVPLAPMTTNERFIRLYYTPANGDLTSSGITAYLTESPPGLNEQYADGITIS